MITRKIKKGLLYEKCYQYIKPFDIIFFKGDALFSSVISLLEKYSSPKSNINCGEFSHVGVVINTDVLDNPKMKQNKLYILESLVGGYFAHGIKDINDEVIFGVQIRDLEDVVYAFDKSNDSIIGWGQLMNNPIDNYPIKEIKEKMNIFCQTYVGKKYDANPYSLLSAVFPFMRKQRKNIENFFHTNEWYFCSEIVALLFKYFAIYPDTVNEKDVLPRDILYPETDTDVMPKIINKLTYITTPSHKDYFLENNKIFI